MKPRLSFWIGVAVHFAFTGTTLLGCTSGPTPPSTTEECTATTSCSGPVGQWEFLGLSSERLRDWMCVLLLFSLSLCLVPAHAAGQTDAALNAPASGSLGSLEGFLSHPPERRIESDNEVRNKPVHLSPGIQAGLNFATFGGDDTDLFREALQGVPGASAADEGRRTGFTAGVFLVADFRGLLALQPELRFIQKGYQIASSVRLGASISSPVGELLP